MTQKVDITGKRYGSVVPLEEEGFRAHRNPYWKCQCQCGKIVSIRKDSIVKHKKYFGCRCVSRSALKKMWESDPMYKVHLGDATRPAMTFICGHYKKKILGNTLSPFFADA